MFLCSEVCVLSCRLVGRSLIKKNRGGPTKRVIHGEVQSDLVDFYVTSGFIIGLWSKVSSTTFKTSMLGSTVRVYVCMCTRDLLYNLFIHVLRG